MASGNAVLQALAGALTASRIDTSSNAFLTSPGPFGFGHIVAAGARQLRDAPVGYSVILLNTSGSEVAIADSVPNTVATLADNEAALCVSTGDAAFPWIAAVLKTNAS